MCYLCNCSKIKTAKFLSTEKGKTMENKSVIIPNFIHAILGEFLDWEVIPKIRYGIGGNSHSTWFISFSILDGSNLLNFEVKITSSYGQFLEMTAYSGLKFDGFTQFARAADFVKLARSNLK